GGSSSASGNGDRFADDRGDIGEYTDEGNRHVVRPRDDRGDIGEYTDEGNRHVVRPRGIHGGRGGCSCVNVYHKASSDLTFGWIKSVFLPENKRGFKLSYPDVRIKS
nr:hypothetical protein [Tanacetum cinerariifolium]